MIKITKETGLEANYLFSTFNCSDSSYGPFFRDYVDLIGKKLLYTRKDIEKFASVLSKTTKNKVLNLKEGKKVKISVNLELWRLSKEELDKLLKYLRLKDELNKIDDLIELRCADLRERESDLIKEIGNMEKIFENSGDVDLIISSRNYISDAETNKNIRSGLKALLNEHD